MVGQRRSIATPLAVVVLLALIASRLQAQTAPAPPTLPASEPPAGDQAPPVRDVQVWGEAGFRVFGLDDQIAPNGLEYKALFRLDMDFNVWLWRSQRLYLFGDTDFWGQRAGAGVTNPSQGVFDFSKREFDLSGGFAWNYAGFWEARAFAYSYNNLNRGSSTWQPTGYDDGVGLENRYYLSDIYASLGTEAFDVSRATFVSVGYYPSKDMVDSQGVTYKPGPFARAYLTFDLTGQTCYLFGDLEFIATRSFTPKVLNFDTGIAFRPFSEAPKLEFRIGTNDLYDLGTNDLETSVYAAIRINF